MLRNPRVKVRVLQTKGGKSAPKHVLQRLVGYKREFQIGKKDQLWLMIDVDRWPKKQLSSVATRARQSNFFLAASNPCFEVWLYLHRGDLTARPPISAEDIKMKLCKLLKGYDSSSLRVEQFEPYVDDAIRRAKALDQAPKDEWPQDNGTRVYKVIESIHLL
jgi:hypothetical protein